MYNAAEKLLKCFIGLINHGISPSHLGQLSLLRSAGREMSTSQSRVTLCGLGSKGWYVWSLFNACHISAIRDEQLIISALLICFLYLLSLKYFSGYTVLRDVARFLCDNWAPLPCFSLFYNLFSFCGFFLLSFFFSSRNLSGRRLDESTILPHMVWP